MLCKDPDFWEKERGSPFFDRSGLTSRSHMTMIMIKFRHIVTLTRQMEARAGPPPGDAHAGRGDGPAGDLADQFGKMRLATGKAEADAGRAEAPPDLESLHRIFRLDAERTFVSEAYRQTLCENLKLCHARVGDYHQGEGFLVALLSIYMAGQDLVRVVDVLNRSVLPGYFSAAPANYVRDARVLFRLLERRKPALHDALSALIVPEAFCSKWFIGLNVHVFDFENVADFIARLLLVGQAYLFEFGLGFLGHFEAELLEADVGRALALLRLDATVVPKDAAGRNAVFVAIMARARAEKVTIAEVEALRADVEREMAEEAERRQKALENLSDDEIVFSDEE